jgi:hypothetical protein
MTTKPMTWTKFLESFTEEDWKEIVADDQRFTKNSVIGDCLLREKAQEWEANINYSGGVIMTMRNISHEAYKYFTNKYFESIYSKEPLVK